MIVKIVFTAGNEYNDIPQMTRKREKKSNVETFLQINCYKIREKPHKKLNGIQKRQKSREFFRWYFVSFILATTVSNNKRKFFCKNRWNFICILCKEILNSY